MTPFPEEPFPSHPRIVFMGTPEFAVPALKALIRQGHHVLAVVTQPDRPKGRGKKLTAPPVKQLALEHGIEVLQPEKASDDTFCGRIREKNPDLIVVVAFGQILRKKLLDIPKWGVINVHGSLLPTLRGAAPVQWTILNDEAKTGLTVMHMDEGMDTGPILFQEEIPVLKDETAGHLYDRLAKMAGDFLARSLERLSGNRVSETPQDHAKATYAPKITKDLCLVDWKETAPKVSARIRGMDPRPGAYTLWEGQEIKLFASTVIDKTWEEGLPGKILGLREEGLVVGTGRGTVGIRELQYPGRNRLPVKEFLRGHPMPEGAVLGQ
ncbi:MAG: methionyl-tRNA formyltransferase [Desulfobacterota bacterium]|nr:methionyl-tRNA formyltransferase [Thermodesulfobacteriota bacterium]